jgi:hypothetical protein
MKAKTLIACAFAVSTAPLAWGQGAQPTGPQGTQLWASRPAAAMTFAQLDTNGDGVISREEYRVLEQRAPGSGPGSAPYSGFSADTNPPVPGY